MKYKGVDYRYAFEFKVHVEGRDRPFRIVISKFREDSLDFSGLSLENEMRVISENPQPFLAFFEIIDRIIKITVKSEKEIMGSNGGEPVKPLLQVEDEAFLRRFEECKKSIESREYYEQLSNLFETRPTTNPDSPDPMVRDLMIFAYYLQYRNYYLQCMRAKIKDIKTFVINEGRKD